MDDSTRNPDSPPPMTPEAAAEVLERLHALERRVEELERQAAPSPVASPPPVAVAPVPMPQVGSPGTTESPRAPLAPPRTIRELRKAQIARAADSLQPETVPSPPPSEYRVPGVGQSAESRPPEFLTQEEYSGKEKPGGRKSPWGRNPDEGWEVALATRVLPVVGGVLLLVGAAIGATLIEGAFAPMVRVALGYLCSVGLIGGGWLVTRKSTPAGQATIAAGFALGYFVSFGGHFLPPMQVFPWVVSLVLMLGFALGMVLLADRWRSQPMAALGLVLGMVGALVSAPASESFALVSLGGLAVAAGGLFLRREWMGLTTAAVALIHVAILLLWAIAPVPGEAGAVAAHLGALLGIHLVFAVAYVRWGRPWVARQNALREAAREGTLPAAPARPLPFAGGYSILNSLGLASLSVLLLWNTRIFWAEVHWLLFALAGGEAARLAVRRLSNRSEQPFHAMLGFVLGCCGIVAMMSGLAESAVLAGAALAAAIAGSRAPVLRSIRPLGAVAAALATVAYFREVMGAAFMGAGAGFTDHAAALLPVLFLLASALPWDRLGTEPTDHPKALFRGIDGLSSSLRALFAVPLFVAYATELSSDGMHVAFAALAILLAGAMAFVNARALGAALLLSVLAFIAEPLAVGRPDRLESALFVLVVLSVPSLLGVSLLGARGRACRVLMMVAGGGVAVMMATGGFIILNQHGGWSGLMLWALALGLGGVVLALDRFGPVPSIGGLATEAEQSPARTSAVMTPGVVTTVLLAAVGYATTLGMNASEGFLFPALVGMTFLPLMVMRVARRVPESVAIAGAVLAAVMWSMGWLVSSEAQVGAALLPAVLAGGLMVVGIGSGLRALQVAALTALGVSLLGNLMALSDSGGVGGGSGALAALVASLVAVGFLGIPILQSKWKGAAAKHKVPDHVARGPAIVGLALTLGLLGASDLLARPLITPSWGMLGGLLLVVGLVMADRTMRYTALGVFAVTLSRIFLHDMVGLDAVTRAVAFFAVGLLLVAGGVAYGLARRGIARPSDDPGEGDGEDNP